MAKGGGLAVEATYGLLKSIIVKLLIVSVYVAYMMVKFSIKNSP
jgi:hypothetical protein